MCSHRSSESLIYREKRVYGRLFFCFSVSLWLLSLIYYTPRYTLNVLIFFSQKLIDVVPNCRKKNCRWMRRWIWMKNITHFVLKELKNRLVERNTVDQKLIFVSSIFVWIITIQTSHSSVHSINESNICKINLTYKAGKHFIMCYCKICLKKLL